MKCSKEQFKILFKSLKTVAINNIPDIVKCIPACGPILSTALSVVLELNGEIQGEIEARNCEHQINDIKNMIEQKGLTEETFRNLMQQEIMKQMKQNEHRIPAYMFGVTLYPFEFIEEEDLSDIRQLFAGEYVMPKPIQEFIDEYCANELLEKDYVLTSEGLMIQFFNDTIGNDNKHLRDDIAIMNLIYSLNEFLEKIVFADYIIY